MCSVDGGFVKTTVLTWGMFLLALTVTGSVHAVPVQPVTGVLVLDARNQRLGLYSSADSTVLMLIDRTVLPIGVDKNGFVSQWDALYATPDCTGAPYMLASDVDREASGLVEANRYKQIGSVVWVGDPDNATSVVPIRSRGNVDRCSRKDGLPTSGTEVIPLMELVDLGTLFVPPFHLLAK